VVTVPEFEAMRRVQPFDETVIVMGNSTFHHYCWDLLTEISGVVLAHELRYTGLFQSYASLRGMGHGFFRDLLLQEYAGLHPSLDLQQFLESDVAADLGIHLVGPIIDRASRFLTTSEHAEQVARLVRPTRSDDIESVGFAYPDTATQVSIERPMPPILASIGIQWHTKRTMDLVRTLSIVQESIPDVRLRLVGPIDETYASDVKTLARELGVHSAVSVLGRVPRDDLEREIASASLALQLRATSNGEVSAAIADCIVAGTPVITTSIGAQTELADAGVELLHLAATPADIAEAVVSILEDDAYREDMSTRGMRWASERDPALAADRLLSAIGLASDRS
jgi:glycosyltransferase involved in cell wall biosynthesis